MIRRARPDDLLALKVFLQPCAMTSMGMLAGLRHHGLNSVANPEAMTFWIADHQGIRAVFALTSQGILTCQMPVFDPRWRAGLHRELAGQTIAGVNGEARQVAALRAALGLDRRLASFDEVVPMFGMNLVDLTLPDGPTRLRVTSALDQILVLRWRWAFDCEVYGDPDTVEMRRRSGARAGDMWRGGRVRILEQDGEPVAMTAFNAALPDIVQVGSVYTPPAMRGRGHARRAVALHLAEARAQGVGAAVLHAASPAAARAYQSIGFRGFGEFAQIDFSSAALVQPIHAASAPDDAKA